MSVTLCMYLQTKNTKCSQPPIISIILQWDGSIVVEACSGKAKGKSVIARSISFTYGQNTTQLHQQMGDIAEQ